MKIYKYVLYGIGGAVALFFAFLFIRYLLPVLLPFGIAYAASAGIRPLSAFLWKKTKIKKKVWSVVLIILSVAAVGGLLWLLGSTLAREATEALKGAGKDILGDDLLKRMSDKVAGVLRRADLFGETMDVKIDIGGILSGAASSLSSWVAGLMGNIVSAAPGVFFFVAVTVISLFYFSCDSEGISKKLSAVLPEKAVGGLKKWADIGLHSLKRFARVYMSLFGVTFAILTAGFFLLKVPYPVLCALIAAVVDILPVFGVGTVLVPWAVIMLLSGRTATGIGLFILLGVVYATRQMLEARLVGEAAGVHPVFALLSVYLGFRLAGVGGMIAAPLLLNGAVLLWEENKKKTRYEVDKDGR